MDVCIFCTQSLSNGEPTVTLGQKGCEGIERASVSRGSHIRTLPGQVVHVKCRSDHVNPNIIKTYNRKRTAGKSNLVEETRSLRSTGAFDYKRDCIFCGCPDPYDGKKSEYILIPVRSFEMRDTILQACDKYDNDWVKIVKPRFLYALDLPAADVVYHQLCSVNFRTGKQVPKFFASRQSDTQKAAKCKRFSGRPKDEMRHEAFLEIAAYLEQNDDEQISVNDLIEKMGEYMEGKECEAYSFKYMKQELKKHFGDRIVITAINGKPNVVTFHTTAAKILSDFHQQQQDTTDEKTKIIETAAKLIKNDIKDIKRPIDLYPSYSEMSSIDEATDFLPESLQTFLTMILAGKDIQVKLASIGQAIMQAARPRVIQCPLQIGLGVQMHHHFQSKFLIDTLNSHGYCSSYSEVTKFERCAAVMKNTYAPDYGRQTFTQYVADNVDHNIRTLDGKKTFHGMGIIATFTPKIKVNNTIKRIDVTSKDIAAVGRINIQSFVSEEDALNTMCYEPLSDPKGVYHNSKLDLLWKISPVLNVSRPLWSGFMQMVHKGDHPQASSVMFLPMIDLDPNDLTCINSTLNFVCSHAKKYNCTPVITFDQPLWWKAHIMEESQPDNRDSVVVRLGGFHTQMSYLGSIGHLMSGSGIHDVLEVIYANNTIGHMLSGKAVSRAVRGHFIVDAALHSILASRVLGTELPCEETGQDLSEDCKVATCDTMEFVPIESVANTELCDKPEVQELSDLMSKLLMNTVTAEDVQSNDILSELCAQLDIEKKRLASFKTARLWLQYIEMIDLLRKFIKGERLGDWKLHLQSLYEMLPYFAASGHRLYLKSVQLYLQKMFKLPEQHPEVYKHFTEGLHVIRRSDRLWAGLSMDLVIEQCLMRSLKTTGGLTRGRGMTETQRLVWVLSSPACGEVNNSMQQLTGIQYTTSEQHKDATPSRVDRDKDDTKEILRYMSERNPFINEPSLRNIATGVAAPQYVNAYDAKNIGHSILKSMEGHNVTEYTLKKKDQAVTMDTKSTVKIHNENVQVNPQLLFQRLVTVGTRYGELTDIFAYELCSYPPALFESTYVMRASNKATLADSLWSPKLAALPGPTGDVQYVLDGGSLLHRIPWTRGSTWEQILEQYAKYVLRRYNKAVVVFDGYSDAPSTKDSAHLRRSAGKVGAVVHFFLNMTLQTKKEEFLSNKENKQRFIAILSKRLEQMGCEVQMARGDADVLIVQTAIAAADKKETVLVGDDTDLLVLLVHHAKNTHFTVFFKPEPKKHTQKEARCWNIAALRTLIGDIVADNILFIHALLGCDTTSGVYGLGKKVAIAKMKTSILFQEQAQIFMNDRATQDDIAQAGEKAMVCLYKGNPGQSINDLRLQRFAAKTSSSMVPVQSSSLPPTSAANKFHSLRVFQQIQEWKGGDHHVNPQEWGWKTSEGKFIPIMTDLQPAPQKLLEIIRCNCRSGCNTMRCSCRKHGMVCSMACSDCRGICSNMGNTSEDMESESDED